MRDGPYTGRIDVIASAATGTLRVTGDYLVPLWRPNRHSALFGIGSDDHHNQSHNHSAAGDGSSISPATLILPSGSPTAEGSVGWDGTNDVFKVGDGAASRSIHPTGAPLTAYTPTWSSVTLGNGVRAGSWGRFDVIDEPAELHLNPSLLCFHPTWGNSV